MSLAERFWDKVKIGEPDECWPWKAYCDPNGYGRIRINGESVLAHRVAYEITKGKLRNDALHSCDNPPCCNPHHLFDGTQADNMRDCHRKGRYCVGESRSDSKLTAEAVIEIRSNYRFRKTTQKMFAEKFGVSTGAILKVIKRRSWKHL